MKFRFFSLLSLVLASFLISCSPQISEMVVAEYGGKYILLSEFEDAYAKNVGGYQNAAADSLVNYKKFLDLYVNFKMKLRDAYVRNYPDNPDLQNELETYKRKVGASYLIEKELVEPGLKKFYDDRKEEVRVSHIMLRTQEKNDDKAKLAQSIIDSIKLGSDFGAFAKKYSDDNFTKETSGDISWFTAGQIIPEFEKAAYSLKIGEVYPEPVLTRFGYHIIKLTDRKPRRYSIQASHIMLKETAGLADTDTASAQYKIAELRKRIVAGEDFAELAKKYSDDRGSGERGGDLGYFSRRQMVPQFDEVAFSLNPGELSDVVHTRFGYHIIKVTGEKEFPSFEQEKEGLRDLYKKTRYEDEYKNFITQIKSEVNYSEDDNLVSNMLYYIDTVKFDSGYWESKFRTKYGSLKLFTINNKDVIVDSLFNFAINNNEFKGKVINKNIALRQAVQKYSEQLLLEEKALSLPTVNKEFAQLMDDYKNGIYIFKLQEDEVWNKLQIDSNEVKKFYEITKENYVSPDRISFSEILVKTDSLANVVYDDLSKGKDWDTCVVAYSIRMSHKQNGGDQGVMEVDHNELSKMANALNNPGEISKPFKSRTGWSIVRLNGKLPSKIKSFEEAQPEAASAYQEMLSKKLEEEYIQRLNELYKPEINYDALQHAFKPNKM